MDKQSEIFIDDRVQKEVEAMIRHVDLLLRIDFGIIRQQPDGEKIWEKR